MVDERDMMYGGYYGGVPGNMAYSNFGVQGMPGSLMMNPNMQEMQNVQPMQNMGMISGLQSNNLYDLNTRISSLESRVKALEKKVNNYTSQDDNSMYMI